MALQPRDDPFCRLTPSPLHKKTQPTTIRAKSGAHPARCFATRSGQPINLSKVGGGENFLLKFRKVGGRSESHAAQL
jgi:hypothetical protein